VPVEAASAAHILMDLGLIEPESVVDGDFAAIDQSSRNINIKVPRRSGPGYFIKQPRSGDYQAIRTVAREAACYSLAASDPRFQTLAPLTPRLHLYEPKRCTLIIELLADSVSVWEHHHTASGFPVDVARLLGRALGSYHRGIAAKKDDFADLGIFDRRLPWVLNLHEMEPWQLPQGAGGTAQLIQIIRRYPQFPTALGKIRSEWTIDSLIHGDMKWENCLLYRPDAGSDALAVKVIDWELADLGDSRWDVGSIIQAYLTFWITSLTIQAGVAIQQSAASSALQGESMRPALREFWKSYSESRGIEGAASGDLLQRCIAHGAARMVQTAFEMTQSAPEVTPHALCLLQMSMNILADPARAVREVVGL
jgi:hypothetical protein